MKYLFSDLKDLANFLLNHATTITLIVILDALVWMLTSQKYTDFLHPRFWPFLVAAIAIIVLYLCAIIFGIRTHSNASMSRKIVKSLVLLTPLFVLYTVVGQGMGVHAFMKKNISTEQGAQQFLKDLGIQAPDEKKINTENEYSLLDLALKMRQLDGQRVVTEGLTYTDANVPEGHMMLFRFVMYCCAADATPVGIVVHIGDSKPLQNESWAKVEGILKITKIHGNDIPVIHADTIKKMKTPPPGAQYIFF